MRRAIAAVVVSLALTGCVSAPPMTQPQTEIETPEQWTADVSVPAQPEPARGTTELAPAWWEQFGDPGLSAAVEQALQQNTDLLAAAARLQQASASARIAGADLKPQLGASFVGTRRKQNFVGFPIPGRESRVLTTRSTNFGVSLDLSWEIDLWGRLGAQAREGLVNFQASQADLAGLRLSIAGQTAKAWFAVAEARQQVELSEHTVESFRQAADQVRDRFEYGVRSPLDLRLALTQLASAEAVLASRRQQLDAAVRQLEVLMGRYPGRTVQVASELVAVPPPVPAGLPADLVSRRPDLAAAERRLAAADQRFLSARAALYPRISLTASGGTSSNQLSDLVDSNFSVWNVVGNIVAPLFQSGRLRAGVDLANATIEERVADYAGTVLRAYAEVESALVAEQLLAEREQHLAEAVEQSEAAQELAANRYRSGLEDYITVLESQRRTFDAQSALISGRRDRLANRIDLILALGGGFRVISGPPHASPLAAAAVEESR